MDLLEQAPQTIEAGGEPNHAQVAERLFVTASGKYSGQTEAIAARLALDLQDKDLDPIELKDALLGEPGRTGRLTDLINGVHGKHRDEPEEPTGFVGKAAKAVTNYFRRPQGPPVVDERWVRRTIEGTFTLAQKRLKEDPEKLRQILEMYEDIKALPLSHAEKLDAYSRRVDALLAQPEEPKSEDRPTARVKPARRVLVGK